MKPYWEITPEEAGACLDATHFCPSSVGYFRGGGYSSEFETRGGMPVTMSRLNMVAGLGPVLQVAEGATVDLPADVARTLWSSARTPRGPRPGSCRERQGTARSVTSTR